KRARHREERPSGRVSNDAPPLPRAETGWQCSEITAEQRFFLLSPPAFDLPLCRSSVIEAAEMLLKYQLYRSAQRGVAIENARLVLGEPFFKAGDRCADVIRAIGAAENVEPSAHASLPRARRRRASFEASLTRGT